MDGEQRGSGWKIWLYMTPLYVLLAIPLVKWTMKLNSPDVPISKEDYGAFNSPEGEVKRIEKKEYDPGLSDLGYTVRYRSGNDGPVESAAPAARGEARTSAARSAQPGGARNARPAAARPAGGGISSGQAALESKDTGNREQMSIGSQKGYLTYAAGKAINNPKAVAALFNNSWVVKGFMERDTVKAALGSREGLQKSLSDPKRVSNFLNNSVVRTAMNNPAVVNAFAASGMASAIMASPAVQEMLQNPEMLTTMMGTNPELTQALTNPNVINALMNNPQTAGLAASLGGAGRK